MSLALVFLGAFLLGSVFGAQDDGPDRAGEAVAPHAADGSGGAITRPTPAHTDEQEGA